MLTVAQPNNNIKNSDDIVNNKDNTDIKLATAQIRHDDSNSTENVTQTKTCKNNEEKIENTKTINTSINVGENDINMKERNEKEPKAEVVVGDVKSDGEITSEVNTATLTSNYDNSIPEKETVSTSNFHLHYYRPKEVPTVSKYKILEEISGGTYGVVYKAEDRVTKKLVALKRMPLMSDREGFSITTIREIKILKYTLPSHINVIQLLDILVDENVDTINQKYIYVVFELMDHDLSGLLHRFGGQFSETQIKHYLKQLFNGLDHCHHNKVLHRDLKGANLLINNHGVLKIADFGLSRDKLKENSTYTKDMVTLWFRAPEILLGCAKYSTSIDLWSAGCLLYELYVGVAPFRGNTELEQIRLIFEMCGYNKNEPPSYEKCLSVEVNTSFTSKLIEDFRSRSRYQFNEQTADLLEKLLCLDPYKRITANDAITHKYFFTPPLLSKEFIHPRYPSTHDQSARPAKKFKDDKGKAHFVDPNKDAKHANQLKHKPPHSAAANQRNEQSAYHSRDAHKHLQYQQARSNPEYVPLPRFSHQTNRGQTYRGQSNRYPATNSNTHMNNNNASINNNNSSNTHNNTQYSNRGSYRGSYNNTRDRTTRDNRDNREKREDRMVEKTERVVTDYRNGSSERTVTERYRREEHKQSTVITAPSSMADIGNGSQSNAQRRN